MNTERSSDFLEIEQKFKARELRLPNGVRKYIRRLKEEGLFQEAMKVRQSEIGKGKSVGERLTERLNLDVRTVIVSDSEKERALGEFDATWILSQTGEIDPSMRMADLNQIYRTYPQQEELLEARGPVIVTEVAKLVKETS